jgi:hypothetical protein
LGLAEIEAGAGDHAAAEVLFEEGLVLVRELGFREGVAGTLVNLARTSISRSQDLRAGEMLRLALEVIDEIDSQRQAHLLLTNASGLAASRGDWEHAARFFGAVEMLVALEGFHLEPTDEMFLAPLIARSRELAGASTFAAAEAQGRELDRDRVLDEVRAWLNVKH